MLFSAMLILLLGFFDLGAIPLLITIVVLLLAPILFAFRVWIEMLE